MRTDHTVTSDLVAKKDKQWPSRHEADCGEIDRRPWKHYKFNKINIQIPLNCDKKLSVFDLSKCYFG